MANVAADQLSKEQKDELLCTYAALILHDDGAEVTPQAMTNLIKAAGCIVESYWPMLMTKMIKTVGMEALIKMGWWCQKIGYVISEQKKTRVCL
eukprot:CAMPEP_0203852422 /NCGR_PEP_ID=MMETSP0359-20131031/7920_1 /ASSEMBLY_ACC=CAM_ASM_000338 /TAXON_ID=268821 /ORGANISM="Scrippsiella Hangoei, Strain SHTV-5" /LENGTH=93 /DNA_ID=CAMNT_0050768581 /DNA_START=67 /DNA_END=345 /DNA_ORIENTATION=+